MNVINFIELFLERHFKQFDYGVGPTTNKPRIKLGGNAMSLSITMTDQQQETVTLNPVNVNKQPAKLYSVPVWAVQSGDVTLQPAADGMSCVIVSGSDEASVVKVSAEGDPTPGVNTVTDLINVTVTPTEAVDLGPTAGTPVPKVVPAPAPAPTPSPASAPTPVS